MVSSEDVRALKNIYLEVEQGELLALLGQNGAGKTTLINILTGMIEPTSGNAQILDFNLNDSIDEIRKVTGICPQFDILWDELTAEEHLNLFARIKGVINCSEEITQRLKDVDLLNVRHAQISTFSGGMKRRVSLAISSIGNPKIIIMDEPTTGMDPKARRQVWEMIKSLKAGRIVLLTTHAMEEADALSDRIAVMGKGELKCIGSSLYLKNTFSNGYRINVICDLLDVGRVINYLKQILQDSVLLDSSGGSILLSLPFGRMSSLKSFFTLIEEDNESNGNDEREMRLAIKDWGISHPTLEEVFRNVTT